MSVRVQPKPTPDILLMGATLALLGLGIEMVYSASFVLAGQAFLFKQVTMAVIGLVAMVVLTVTGYHWLERISLPIMIITVLLLLVVLLPGVSVDRYGAHRWIGLRVIPEFQPSEIAKVALIIYMSAWLGRKKEQVKEFWRGFIPFALVMGLVTVLIMIEPDMGTSFVIVLTATCIFFVAGANLVHFVALGAMGVVGFAFLMVGAAYRLDRFTAFLDPWADARGTGWHTVQTLIALGSGGVTGLGLGASRQKFFYVPNAHTDAIFAIIGEELGLVGAAVVIVLFGVIAWRGFVIAMKAPDSFGRLIATGVTSTILVQALTNIAVVTNTVPYTGITLPLISYGGSSLVVTLAALGLLLGVSRYAGVAPTHSEQSVVRPSPLRRSLPRRQPGTSLSPSGANLDISARPRTARGA